MEQQIEKNKKDIAHLKDQLFRVVKYLLKKDPKEFFKDKQDHLK